MTSTNDPHPIDVTDTLARASEGSWCLRTDDMAWQPTDSPGFWIKVLLDEAGAPDRGGRPSHGNTQLMRVDAGAFADFHDHDQLEEIFVLDGEFTDQHTTYRAGDYCLRAIGATHIAGSDTGCTVLLVYRD
ncbi:MAG: hypothetical protein JWM34_3377 [Ilumatobacteraceae bacterium]|nr:hypothetical protein [Ilumatobacteraceae bacterium]